MLDKETLATIILDQEFMMYNEGNKFKGELTVLDAKDVEDIVYDMYRGAKAEVDESGIVTIKYPFNICILISVEPLMEGK